MTAPKATPIDKLKADILAGTYDEHVGDIVRTIVERSLAGGPVFRWQFVLNGETIREDDLALGMTSMVERITKTDWGDFDPRLRAEWLRVLLAVYLHKRDGISLDEAEKKVDALNHSAIVASFSEYEVPQVPFGNAPG